MRDTTRKILRTVYRSCYRILRRIERRDENSTLYLSERAKPTDWGSHRNVTAPDRAARLVSALSELRTEQGALPSAEDGPVSTKEKSPPRQLIPIFPEFLREVSDLVSQPGSGVPAGVALKALSQGYREGWNGSIGFTSHSTGDGRQFAGRTAAHLDDAASVRLAFGALRVVGRLAGLQSVSSQATTQGVMVLVSPEELMKRTFAYK